MTAKEPELLVQGLDGKKTLKGKVQIGGAKNAALPLFASSILFGNEVHLSNIPEIEDMNRMCELLEGLGVKAVNKGNGEYVLDGKDVKATVLDREIAKRMRASVMLTGPLLARFGKVSLPHPGGCVIGARPIDIFVDGFACMGVTFEEVDGMYNFEAPQGLKGSNIAMRVPSVTATEAFMMAAVLAEGETTIKNAAMEPEIVNLAEFLISSGADIKGVGTATIKVKGSKELLKAKSESFKAIPDRIEAGSYLILGALCADDLFIEHCEPKHLEAVTSELIAAGVPLEVGPDYLHIKGNGDIPNESFKAFDIKTREYPGFPTDLQAPMSVFLSQASGESLVFETIFENRLGYGNDLVTMGANTRMLDAHRMIVKGPTKLKARELYGPDLRAGLAFIIAALTASGQSRIHNVYYVDRGYERIEEKLQKLGASVTRV